MFVSHKYSDKMKEWLLETKWVGYEECTLEPLGNMYEDVRQYVEDYIMKNNLQIDRNEKTGKLNIKKKHSLHRKLL